MAFRPQGGRQEQQEWEKRREQETRQARPVGHCSSESSHNDVLVKGCEIGRALGGPGLRKGLT
jgi:hypothetical protein